MLGILALVGVFLVSSLVSCGKPSISPTPTAAAASWWEVYFTDPVRINDPQQLEGSIPEKLIQAIDAAQSSIHIAAFEFNLTPVAEALVRAQQRGVDVRWVTDDEHGLESDAEAGHGQFAILQAAGIPIKDDGRSALMHDKFWIFDRKSVWTGSTNITLNDNFRNNNNVIFLHSPTLAEIYEREFAEMWAGKFGATSPSTLSQQSLTQDGVALQIYFAAEDEVIDRLLPLLARAQTSIRFMAFSFTHDGMEQTMLERAAAGVDIQGIFENRASLTEFSALTPLYCAGILVRQDGNPGTFHHKVIVIDGKTLITGSLNFSANADENNDENTLVVLNSDIAKLYLEEFDRRWAEARQPDPANITCK
jgi:phosphatidylserine/phosphatidylglycerophosphate/cardiolipin synthase-like enzyme